MKKYVLLIFLLAIISNSCTKNLDLVSEDSVVTFNVDAFSNGKPLTKSFSDSEVMNLVESSLPDFYYLKATNIDNNNTYEFESKSSVVLPNGTYAIKSLEVDNKGRSIRWDSKRKYWNSNIGHRCDDEFVYAQTTGGVILCNSPRICVNDTIVVSKNGTITLKGIIGSSAIVWDSSVVEKIQILETGNDGIFDLKCFVQKDKLCITFHQETNPWPVDIMIYPKEGLNYQKKKMRIPSVLQQGYWYSISPIPAENYDTDFSINISLFQNAGEL